MTGTEVKRHKYYRNVTYYRSNGLIADVSDSKPRSLLSIYTDPDGCTRSDYAEQWSSGLVRSAVRRLIIY